VRLAAGALAVVEKPYKVAEMVNLVQEASFRRQPGAYKLVTNPHCRPHAQ
jgi:hypothetical protein